VALPGVLGIKLARPEKLVIGFSGDGGAMYVPQALWTAAHYRIGAKFVICNNRSYRLLKLNMLQYWQEQGIAPHDFPAPSTSGSRSCVLTRWRKRMAFRRRGSSSRGKSGLPWIGCWLTKTSRLYWT